MTEPFSEAIRQFLSQTVDSVMQLEAILLLFHTHPRAWTFDEMANELRIDPIGGRQQLQSMLARGILVAQEVDRTFVLSDAVSSQGELLRELQRHYNERRVAVISMIYGKPSPSVPDPLQQFADAFRLRRPRPPQTPDGESK